MKLIDAEILYNEIREKRDVYAERLGTDAERDRDLFYYGAFQIVLSIIRDQKIYDNDAVDAETVPSGEWIEDDYGFFHCSACDFEFDEPEVKTHCCPNCGAMMTNYEKRGAEDE